MPFSLRSLVEQIQQEISEARDAAAIRQQSAQLRTAGRRSMFFNESSLQLGLSYERERLENTNLRPDTFADGVRDGRYSVGPIADMPQPPPTPGAVALGFAQPVFGPQGEEQVAQQRQQAGDTARQFQQDAQGQGPQLTALDVALQEEDVSAELFRQETSKISDFMQRFPQGQPQASQVDPGVMRVINRLGGVAAVPGLVETPTRDKPSQLNRLGGIAAGVGRTLVTEPAEAEVEALRPITRPASAALFGATPPGQALQAATAVGVPGARSVFERGEELARDVGQEVLVPSSLFPIPIIDPLVAKSLGLVFRGGKFVLAAGRAATRGEITTFARETAEIAAKGGGEAYRAASEAFQGVLSRGGGDAAETATQAAPVPGQVAGGVPTARGAPLEAPTTNIRERVGGGLTDADVTPPGLAPSGVARGAPLQPEAVTRTIGEATQQPINTAAANRLVKAGERGISVADRNSPNIIRGSVTRFDFPNGNVHFLDQRGIDRTMPINKSALSQDVPATPPTAAEPNISPVQTAAVPELGQPEALRVSAATLDVPGAYPAVSEVAPVTAPRRVAPEPPAPVGPAAEDVAKITDPPPPRTAGAEAPAADTPEFTRRSSDVEAKLRAIVDDPTQPSFKRRAAQKHLDEVCG